MSSHFIAKMMGEPSGTLKGKSKVREYWRTALSRVPDLHFELLAVFTGATAIVIHYKSILGLIACESLTFDAGGKICRAAARYDRI